MISTKNTNTFDHSVACLQHPSAAQRIVAIDALARLGDFRAFEHLLPILQNDQEELFVRQHAARAIGSLHDIRVVPYLVDMFRISPSQEQLSQIPLAGLSLDDLLAYGSSFLDPAILQSLQLTSSATHHAITNGIQEALLHAIKQALVEIGTAALPMLIKALKDDHPNVRAEVAITLCYIHDNACIPALQQVFHDPDPLVKQAIVTHISQFCDSRFFQHVWDATYDNDVSVRDAACFTLGRFAHFFERSQSIERLIQLATTDPSLNVRETAQDMLQRLEQWATYEDQH